LFQAQMTLVRSQLYADSLNGGTFAAHAGWHGFMQMPKTNHLSETGRDRCA